MNKLIIALILVIVTVTGKAQNVNNGDMEIWINTPTSEPNGWFTNNTYLPSQYIHVTQVNGSSGSAARIATSGSYYVPGVIITPLSDPSTGEGGIPYTGTGIPTHFKGTYRYSVAMGDSAIVLLMLKKNGTVIGQDVLYVTGNQSSFTNFSLPLQPVTVVPDSLIVMVVSSVAMTSSGPFSWLEIDELAIEDQSGTVPIQDGNFDNWVADTLFSPQYWTLNGDVNQTTDAHGGSFAAQLITDITPNGLVVGQVSFGAALISKDTDTLVGYYKYSSPGNDSAEIITYIEDASAMVTPVILITHLPPVATYTEFKIPLPALNVQQSYIRFTLRSSSASTAIDSSILYMDDIFVKMGQPVGVNSLSGDREVALYPNPVHNMVHITTGKAREQTHVQIFDTKGRIVCEELSNDATITISLKHLPGGVYVCFVTQGDKLVRKKIIKE